MGEQMASKENVLIAIVAAAGDAGLDRIQLQKSAFLVGEQFNSELPSGFYEFRPHFYGPFAQPILDDIEWLCTGPMIEIVPHKHSRHPSYRLVEDVRIAQFGLSENLEAGISEIVSWVKSMDFYTLTRAIYLMYPEFLEKSVLVFDEDKALGESLERSVRQFQNGEVYDANKRFEELNRRYA